MMDLSEVEKQNFLLAVQDIDEDFNDEDNNYNLLIGIDKNNKKEDSIEVGWAVTIINTSVDDDKPNALIIKY
jgi:hypothetical protein